MKKDKFKKEYKKIEFTYPIQKYFVYWFILFNKTYIQKRYINDMVWFSLSLLARKTKYSKLYYYLEKILIKFNAYYCSLFDDITINSNDFLEYLIETNKANNKYLNIYYFFNPDNYISYLESNYNKNKDSELCFLSIFKLFKFIIKFYFSKVYDNYLNYLEDWNDSYCDFRNIKIK